MTADWRYPPLLKNEILLEKVTFTISDAELIDFPPAPYSYIKLKTLLEKNGFVFKNKNKYTDLSNMNSCLETEYPISVEYEPDSSSTTYTQHIPARSRQSGI